MVQTVPGNTWIDGGEENVAVAKTIHYTADEVKAGDYIYSGRSTSDGGLRKRYPNGKAQVIADPKPQSVAGKTVAGVVFCIPKDTDPTGRLTPARLTDDKIMMKDFPNAEIWNYIVNPSLVAAGGPTPIYTTSYWSSTEAYYSPMLSGRLDAGPALSVVLCQTVRGTLRRGRLQIVEVSVLLLIIRQTLSHMV